MQHSNTKKSEIIFKLLGQVLREERIKQGKSLRTLAYEYDLQTSLLSRLENCNNEPKLISIWSVCEALNIKPSELLSKIETKLPKNFSLIEN